MGEPMKTNILLVVLTLASVVAVLHLVELSARKIGSSPDQDSKPAVVAEAQQFDFWLGEWDLTWGTDGKGTNTIRSILNGHIVQENFVATSGKEAGFSGMSVSAYNKERGTWLQTWVDNQGGYLDFVGGFADRKMVLSRHAARNGQEFLQRMVWQDIARDSLNWSWERSTDDGKTWRLEACAPVSSKIGDQNEADR